MSLAAAALLASSTTTAVAMAVGGIVAVLAISAVFYAIGRSEDRDRRASPHDAQAADAPPGEEGAPAAGPARAEEPRRSRLPRSARAARRRR